MPNKREEFIKELYAQTYQLAQDEKIPHDFIMAQAIQETGWGEKILKDTHNIFNIKADASWKGERSTHKVWEIEDGKKVWVDADFRKYDSYEESVSDWIDFLHTNKRYEALFEKPNLTTAEFATRIHDAGYATDPNYAKNIVRITQGKTYKDLVGKAQEAYEHKQLDNFDESALKEPFRGHIYLNSEGIPAIGYGHTFFTSEGDLSIQAIRDVQALGLRVSLHDYHMLQKIEQELHQDPKDIQEIQNLANNIKLSINQSDAKTLFLHTTDYTIPDTQINTAKEPNSSSVQDNVDTKPQESLGVTIDISQLQIVQNDYNNELDKSNSKNDTSCNVPPWMKIAMEQSKEIGGRNEHQVDAMIREYHNATDYNKGAGASSPWCASFVSWALKESGMKDTPTRSGSRFFRDESENLEYGHGLKPIPKGEERLGDIAVWADLDKNGEHKGSGHVSFVFGKDKNGDELFLGGNQGNTLGVAKYSTEDTEKRAFIGFFRPEEAEYTSTCDLTKYSSVLQANQAAMGQEIEIGESTR